MDWKQKWRLCTVVKGSRKGSTARSRVATWSKGQQRKPLAAGEARQYGPAVERDQAATARSSARSSRFQRDFSGGHSRARVVDDRFGGDVRPPVVRQPEPLLLPKVCLHHLRNNRSGIASQPMCFGREATQPLPVMQCMVACCGTRYICMVIYARVVGERPDSDLHDFAELCAGRQPRERPARHLTGHLREALLVGGHLRMHPPLALRVASLDKYEVFGTQRVSTV